MTSLSGFDDWLNHLVDEQAAHAEQSVEAYVAQAVATRLMADGTRRNEEFADLLAHLSEAGIDIPEQSPGPNPVVTDPERLAALR
ncbi:histidine kinase, partial [Mycobacterium sp. ITM-2017-0098]